MYSFHKKFRNLQLFFLNSRRALNTDELERGRRDKNSDDDQHEAFLSIQEIQKLEQEIQVISC